MSAQSREAQRLTSLTTTKAGKTYQALSALMDQVEGHVFDLYVQQRDQEAIDAATALKNYAVGVRYKAADAIDAAVQQLRQAQDEPARQAALQQLDLLTRPAQVKAGGHLRDAQKPNDAIRQIAEKSAPALYAQKGTKQ